jgi:hypothetical protein
MSDREREEKERRENCHMTLRLASLLVRIIKILKNDHKSAITLIAVVPLSLPLFTLVQVYLFPAILSLNQIGRIGSEEIESFSLSSR